MVMTARRFCTYAPNYMLHKGSGFTTRDINNRFTSAKRCSFLMQYITSIFIYLFIIQLTCYYIFCRIMYPGSILIIETSRIEYDILQSPMSLNWNVEFTRVYSIRIIWYKLCIQIFGHYSHFITLFSLIIHI